LFLGLLDGFEEPLQVLRLLQQEFDFLLARLGVILALLINNGLNRLNLRLLLEDTLLLLLVALLKLALLRG